MTKLTTKTRYEWELILTVPLPDAVSKRRSIAANNRDKDGYEIENGLKYDARQDDEVWKTVAHTLDNHKATFSRAAKRKNISMEANSLSAFLENISDEGLTIRLSLTATKQS